MEFAHTLRLLRKRAGHEKARSFHAELQEKGVEINYAYYMKMESGQVIPSHKVVEEISRSLPDDQAATLILSYCRTLFPREKHLFPSPDSTASLAEESERETSGPPVTQGQGRELTRRQVNILARSKTHYHLFLIATLARKPLEMNEIRKIFPAKFLQVALQDLEQSKILRLLPDGLKTTSSEHQFPSERDFPELKPLYRQFDEWDETFAEDFDFTARMDKRLIRRISPRYLNVIEKSLDMVLSLVRASDELEDKYNEDLIQIRLSLRSGRLPG